MTNTVPQRDTGVGYLRIQKGATPAALSGRRSCPGQNDPAAGMADATAPGRHQAPPGSGSSTSISPTPEIPWHLQVKALVACAYTCRDCDRAVVTDDDPPVVQYEFEGRERLDRLVVLCTCCAAKRDELRAAWPPIEKHRAPTNWGDPGAPPGWGDPETCHFVPSPAPDLIDLAVPRPPRPIDSPNTSRSPHDAP